MATAKDWMEIQHMIEVAEHYGFKITTSSRYNNGLSFGITATDKTPVYSKDVNIYEGDTQAMLAFFSGWDNCLQFLQVLGATDNKKIAAKIQQYKQNEVLLTLKDLPPKTKIQ